MTNNLIAKMRANTVAVDITNASDSSETFIDESDSSDTPPLPTTHDIIELSDFNKISSKCQGHMCKWSLLDMLGVSHMRYYEILRYYGILVSRYYETL